jgi:diguanylate cyclase (GGDEF)-like protein
VDLTTCDREPIHTPGAIQPHGALLVSDARDWRVTHASANLDPRIFGRTLASVIGQATCAEIETALQDEGYAPARIFTATLPTLERPRCDIVAHRLGGLVYAELEPAGDENERDALLSRAHAAIHVLRRAQTRQELCETAAREFKALAGYDRVMVYRFEADGHGEVVAEACEEGMEPFLGLRYPAGDIPSQARRLYLMQRVRVIADVGYSPVPVLAHPDLHGAAPLDMSYCALRGISPLHLEYLANMGVGASLAVSLIQDSALWGMLVCHHRAPRRVSAHLRALCDLVGQLLSLLIGAKGQAEVAGERLQRQLLLDALGRRTMGAGSVADALAERPDDLLALLKADGALIRLGGKAHLIGRTPRLPDAAKIMASMRARCAGDGVGTEALASGDPDFADLADTASGAFTMPILHNPEDAITWFRPEVARTVTWGGNPDKAVEQDPVTGRLSPRKSFAAWQSLLKGHALPWRDIDLAVAQDLRRLITTALLRQTESQLAHLSHYDELTNLPNRRLLQERLATAENSPRTTGALIFLDLDRFKTVNDSLGHAVGDELLIQVANRLVQTVSTRHLVARIGGDEFVVLCDDATLEEAQGVADDIVAAFRSPFLLSGKPFRTTASVGIAPASSSGTEDPMRAADAAMYAAKRKGGNRAVTFESPLHEAVLSRLEIEQDLFQALERSEFELHYQPLVRIRDRSVFGFEALLRWHHPVRGMVPPNDFVRLAEENDLIVPIGTWVMQEALRQVRIWRERYGDDLVVSVNVSAQQTARPDFPGTVAAALAAAGVPSAALLIEVTESILMQDAAVAHLEAVRATGVRIAVDDFGTGYSSLAYLQKLPVDEIKIDKLFVDQLGEDVRQTAFMGALVHLAHTLDLKVIAEGVEREGQWDHLRGLFCDGAQGYLISRPVPAAEAERFLAPDQGPLRWSA